jgi:dinuclear metal center YbgI/SA1388 family protein
MDTGEFCARLDEKLDTDAYADVDASANGLQIGTESGSVDRVAFAVDAAVEPIERAIAFDADVLVVHHGLSWGGFDRVTDQTYRRIEPLVEHDIDLYVSHLPLDGHQTLGNAAGLADALGLVDCEPFGSVGGELIGQRGRVPEPYDLDSLQTVLERHLDLGGSPIQTLDHGPDEIRDLAIVTGSGVDWLGDAADVGADALLTGEGKQQAYHESKELGINVVLAGHYATETFGVGALRDLAREWGLETTFVDAPTGL